MAVNFGDGATHWKLGRRWVIYLVLACFLILCGSILAYFLATKGKIISGVTIEGTPLGGLEFTTAVKLLERKYQPHLQSQVVLKHQNQSLKLTIGAIGIQPNADATVHQAYRLGREGPLWTQLFTRWKIHRQGRNLKLQFINDQARLSAMFHLLDTTIAVQPIRSAVTVTRSGKVTFSPGRIGQVIEDQALVNSLENVVRRPKGFTVVIPVQTQAPILTENEVKKWELDQILGIYSTKFDPGHTDRSHNLKIASNAIDNVLVYPGQKFSFNALVGPRLSETGYKEAPVVFQGKLVPGIGGGVCQVSTTLYNAVLLANLQVAQRFNHTLPSGYVPLSRDATVDYGGLDFAFENSDHYPVLVTSRVEPPYLTVAILGSKKGWRKVSLETIISETYPFSVKEIPDPLLAKGERVKDREGQVGLKTELWQTVTYDDGTIKKSRVNTSIYPAQPEEYKIGIKEESTRSDLNETGSNP